jgi:hypothetical protein
LLQHLGIYVTCSVGESSSVVHLEAFAVGMAPLLLINDTEEEIRYGQKQVATGFTLPKQHVVLWTWAQLLRDRTMELRVAGKTIEHGMKV